MLNIQLITNDRFESNMTGWAIHNLSNATSDIYVNTKVDLAHTVSGYLYGENSKGYPIYIRRTNIEC